MSLIVFSFLPYGVDLDASTLMDKFGRSSLDLLIGRSINIAHPLRNHFRKEKFTTNTPPTPSTLVQCRL